VGYLAKNFYHGNLMLTLMERSDLVELCKEKNISLFKKVFDF
jgi:hypothetical protein